MGNSAKRDIRKAELNHRRADALRLRYAHKSYQQISDEMGYSSKSHASQDIKAAIREIIEEPAKDVIALELGRLDLMAAAIWGSAELGALDAIDRLLKIQDRRAKYLGLDAPKRSELTGANGGPVELASMSVDDVEAMKRRLAQEMLAAYPEMFATHEPSEKSEDGDDKETSETNE